MFRHKLFEWSDTPLQCGMLQAGWFVQLIGQHRRRDDCQRVAASRRCNQLIFADDTIGEELHPGH